MSRCACSKETQGKTDQFISSWLKQQKREDIVLATKVHHQSPWIHIPERNDSERHQGQHFLDLGRWQDMATSTSGRMGSRRE